MKRRLIHCARIRRPNGAATPKFGIWSHWGPQSVAMFGDWYARNMYIQGTPQYEYHVRHYGHPSEVRLQGPVPSSGRPKTSIPDGLDGASIPRRARAISWRRPSHHDHFFNYASDIKPLELR